MLKPSLIFILIACSFPLRAGVVATWLFDGQTQAHPSTILNDCGLLGRSAHFVSARLGNALQPIEPEPLQNGIWLRVWPMRWGNATYAKMLTGGETDRRSGGFANASDTSSAGVVFEVRQAWLVLAVDRGSFKLANRHSATVLNITADAALLRTTDLCPASAMQGH